MTGLILLLQLYMALIEKNIRYWNLYNVDEKGFLLGYSWRSHVVVFRRSDISNPPPGAPTVPQDGSREFVTVIDCICADGSALPPFIIMKGKRPSFAWAKDSELEDAWIAASPNGWSDNELGVDWLEKLFDPATKEKAAGEWRCLVLDNHESHISFEFIEYAWSNKIIVVSLAPKTSGITQPLDVAVFKDYAQEYGKAADEQLHGKVAISKQDFPRLLPQARRKAFTRTNIVRGFEQASIWPFNPDCFDFMREYHKQQQNTASSSPNPTQPQPLPPQPSTPEQCRARLLNEVERLQHSPPDTPSRPMQLVKELKEQVERGRAYEAILSERIHKFGATEGARSKTGDCRRVPGQSRVFNQHTLNELREKRDEADRIAATKKTRAQNGSRGRPRGGRRGRGRGRGRGWCL
jgi:hypothetical protein